MSFARLLPSSRMGLGNSTFTALELNVVSCESITENKQFRYRSMKLGSYLGSIVPKFEFSSSRNLQGTRMDGSSNGESQSSRDHYLHIAEFKPSSGAGAELQGPQTFSAMIISQSCRLNRVLSNILILIFIIYIYFMEVGGGLPYGLTGRKAAYCL